MCPIDPPDDYFRARLVCTLLTTCGSFFDRGALKKRLDNFLTFFIVSYSGQNEGLDVYHGPRYQMYLRCKGPPPMDVDFLLQDTFEQLRPKLNIYLGYEQAAQAVDEMLEASAADGQGTSSSCSVSSRKLISTLGTVDEAEEEEDEPTVRAEDVEDGIDDAEEADGAEELPEEEAELEESDDEDLPRGSIPPEEEDLFARELAKLMAETGAPAAGGAEQAKRSAGLEQGLPFLRKQGAPRDEAEDVSGSPNMTFTLLTKKGNKQQVHPSPLHCATSSSQKLADPRDAHPFHCPHRRPHAYPARAEPTRAATAQKARPTVRTSRGGRGTSSLADRHGSSRGERPVH